MYEENPPLDEVYDFYTMSEDDFYDENNLTHYGMPRRSGRYPWGSGDNPYQHSADFMAIVLHTMHTVSGLVIHQTL